MRVFAINGSPTTADQSITELVMGQVLEGMRSAGAETEIARLSEKDALPCDCGHRFACWVETPGRCVHEGEDDVHEMLQLMVRADLIVFATPLYLESMSGQMKVFLDRTLPLVQPFIEVFDGESRHPLRAFKEGKLIALISVCGHYEATCFDALVHTFERIAVNLHGKLTAPILRPHAMVLRHPERTESLYGLVMEALRNAGRQLVIDGTVDAETKAQIAMPLMDRDAFVATANRVWRESMKLGEFH